MWPRGTYGHPFELCERMADGSVKVLETGTTNAEGNLSFARLIVYTDKTGMDAPLVYQLFCQGHGWVATCGRDKR